MFSHFLSSSIPFPLALFLYLFPLSLYLLNNIGITYISLPHEFLPLFYILCIDNFTFPYYCEVQGRFRRGVVVAYFNAAQFSLIKM